MFEKWPIQVVNLYSLAKVAHLNHFRSWGKNFRLTYPPRPPPSCLGTWCYQWGRIFILGFCSSLFVLTSRSSANYLASAHTPIWWVSGLLSRFHKLSPSSDSFARPSFMAWACKHFRVVVESLEETADTSEINQPYRGGCEFPSLVFLLLISLSQP